MSWTHDKVLAEVRTVIEQYSDAAEGVSEQTELVGDLGIDSLGVMEVVADLEDRFDMTIGDDDLRTVATLGDVATAIEGRLRKDGRMTSA